MSISSSEVKNKINIKLYDLTIIYFYLQFYYMNIEIIWIHRIFLNVLLNFE